MGEKSKEDANNDEKLDGENGDNELGNNKNSQSNVNANDNDNDSSDEEQANDDGDDATGIKLKSRKVDETEYDDPDDAEEQMDGKGKLFLHV